MATKKLSEALAELQAAASVSGLDVRLVVAGQTDTDNAQTITLQQLLTALNVPTAQSGTQGTTKNYIYSTGTDADKNCVASCNWWIYSENGRIYVRWKRWGADNNTHYDHDNEAHQTSQYMIPYMGSDGGACYQDGLLPWQWGQRMKDCGVNFRFIREELSTAEYVNLRYLNFANGGAYDTPISKATSAKAGVMTAEDKTKLDNLTAYARDLGNFESEEAALNALKAIEISSNSNIVHAHCTYSNGAMSITMMQSIENDYCRQIIFNKSKLYQRAIYFTSGERTEISYAEDWSFLSGDRLSWDSENNKYSLCAFGTAFNQAYCDPIPTATANNDGLMSAADKQKLDNVPTNTKAKLKKLSNPDFKVVVRKAIPLHPRKGMYYFFDRGIRFNTSRIREGKETLEIPPSGLYLYSLSGSNIIALEPGLILNSSNYRTYFKYSDVLIRSYDHPCLVKVCRDGYAFDDGVLKVTPLKTYNQYNFKCRKKYLEVVCGRVIRIVPPLNISSCHYLNDVEKNGFQLYKLIHRVACKYKYNPDTGTYVLENIKDGDGVFKARRYKKIRSFHELEKKPRSFYFVGLARRVYIHSRRKYIYGNIVRCRIAKDTIQNIFYIKKFV